MEHRNRNVLWHLKNPANVDDSFLVLLELLSYRLHGFVAMCYCFGESSSAVCGRVLKWHLEDVWIISKLSKCGCLGFETQVFWHMSSVGKKSVLSTRPFFLISGK